MLLNARLNALLVAVQLNARVQRFSIAASVASRDRLNQIRRVQNCGATSPATRLSREVNPPTPICSATPRKFVG